MESVKGTLKRGLLVAGATHKDYELREPLTADLLAAEADAPVEKTLAYDVALLCQVLVRVGEFSGPFTPELLGRLKPVDLNELRRALTRAYDLGEPAPAATETG
jgi:phage FluMu protein gp41